MQVVGLFQLVLDDDGLAGDGVLAVQVEGKVPDGVLGDAGRNTTLGTAVNAANRTHYVYGFKKWGERGAY